MHRGLDIGETWNMRKKNMERSQTSSLQYYFCKISNRISQNINFAHCSEFSFLSRSGLQWLCSKYQIVTPLSFSHFFCPNPMTALPWSFHTFHLATVKSLPWMHALTHDKLDAVSTTAFIYTVKKHLSSSGLTPDCSFPWGMWPLGQPEPRNSTWCWHREDLCLTGFPWGTFCRSNSGCQRNINRKR